MSCAWRSMHQSALAKASLQCITASHTPTFRSSLQQVPGQQQACTSSTTLGCLPLSCPNPTHMCSHAHVAGLLQAITVLPRPPGTCSAPHANMLPASWLLKASPQLITIPLRVSASKKFLPSGSKALKALSSLW